MKLTITFTNHDHTQNYDVQVNPQQKILDTLHILAAANVINQISPADGRIKSLRRGMYISIEKTYEDAQLYPGDILELS